MPEENQLQTLQKLMERTELPSTPGPNGRPFIILPDKYQVACVEHLLANPARKTGLPQFQRQQSFCQYVNDQKTEASRLYVPTATSILVVFNHHGTNSQAGWGDHKATLTLTHTQEWKTWAQFNNSKRVQRDFAQFIEDNSEDVATPTGAELLELIRTIKTSTNLECTGEIDDKGDTASGGFIIQTKTKAGAKQELELPGEFLLMIAPYEGSAKLPVLARLRIEACPPKLSLWYELLKVQKIEKKALEDIVAAIEVAVDMTAWFGQP